MFRNLVEECEQDYHDYCVGDLKPDDIVISGMAGRFPSCDNIKELKEGIYAKKKLVFYDNKRFPKGVYDNPVGSSGCIRNLDKFEVDFFSMPHTLINSMDPGCRKLLEVTYEAFADAGYDLPGVYGANIGVYNANSSTDFFILGYCQSDLQHEGYSWTKFVNANRITYFFNLHGPSMVIDTSCSSSLAAFYAAYTDLKDGKIDGAIVNSCQINLLPQNLHLMIKAGIISTSGICAPFDEDADGTIRSDGVAAIFLQRASMARRAYATVLGTEYFTSGFVSEGVLLGLTVPSLTMQENMNKLVLKKSGLHSDQVDYIEANGTGSVVGDEKELKSIETVYCTSTRKKPIHIGSVKGNIGHTESTAGLAGIIKVLLAFETGNIAPNYYFKKPNPNSKGLMNGSVKVVSEATPLSSPYVPISCYGLGGTIISTVLKQNNKTYPRKYSTRATIPRLALVSGTCENAVKFLIDYVKDNPNLPDEFFALLHKLSFCQPQLKPYRGYILCQKDPSEIENIKNCTEVERPVWFIYTGMGCQWKGMALQLMEIDIFASTMRKCAGVLMQHGIDLFKIVSSDSDLLEQDRHIMPAFVSITAIQIAITDLLHHIGIHPDGLVGHSAGEIAASYGDGCSTLEETMLLALARGLSVEETQDLVRGLMAATGLSWKLAQELCPENVYASCHNADDSVTISGLKDDVENFVSKLKKQDIFATLVNTYGYSFHSKYIRPAAEKLKTKKVIKVPKRRTKRWLSSSVPEADWEQPRCQIVGDDYFVNNLVSPVLFNEVVKKIPSNAITIEISSHTLLQSVLKRGIGSKRTNIGLVNKKAENGVNFLLESIGTLYQQGLNPKVEKLYPPMQFPVPRNTPCISDLIKWNHSLSFKVRKWEPQTGESTQKYNLNREASYLLDYSIDGKTLFPASGYIVFAWEMLAKNQNKKCENLPIIIENFKINRAIVLNMDVLELRFHLLKDSRNFEIFEGSSLVASGRINEWENRTYSEPEPVYDGDKESTVDGKDVYNDLRIRGYECGPEFQGLEKMSLDGTQYTVRWKERWIPFLENCLQTYVMAIYDEFVLPTEILSIKIDPKAIKKRLTSDENNKEIPMKINKNTNICRSIGIEIEHVSADRTTRRIKEVMPVRETHTFVPYMFQHTFEKECNESLQRYMKNCNNLLLVIGEKLKMKTDKLKFKLKQQESIVKCDVEVLHGNPSLFTCLKHISQNGLSQKNMQNELGFSFEEFGKDPVNFAITTGYALKIMLDIIAENTFQKLNVTEIGSQCSPILQHIGAFSKKHPHLRFKSYTLLLEDENSIDNDILSQADITLLPSSSISKLGFEKKDVVVSSFYSGSSTALKKLIGTACSILARGGFVLLHHKEQLTSLEEFLSKQSGRNIHIQSRSKLEQILKHYKLMIVSCARNAYGSALYLLRFAMSTDKNSVLKITANHSFSRVDEIKKSLRQSDNEYIWLISEDDASSGMLGMVKCLKQEPGGEKIRCVFVSSKKNKTWPPSFDLNNSFYKDILAKNLVMNVWRDESWGSIRHLEILERMELKNVEHSFVRCRNPGDLSSFAWIESQVKYEDLRDNILAHIYYSAINFKDVMAATGKLSIRASKTDSYLGFEFSGRDESGRRIAGITKGCGIATATIVNPAFVIDVPDEWSLEQAATVPVAYATAFYALIIRGGLCKGQSILIHSATGGVGLAAIRIAIHYECEIFVSVGTELNRKYLRKLFPQLKEENILNSRENDFEMMIKNRTKGKGVELVLNSVADGTFQASLRCLAKHGHFLDIGQYDLSQNRNLGLKIFLNNISFDSVMFDQLIEDAAQLSKTMDLVKEGIRSGLVKPLDKTVFKTDEIETAFRYMSRGVQIGKVLIKIRDEELPRDTPPKCLMMKAIPHTYFYAKKSYIIIGGLGSFGIEVTKWILMKGGKNIIITSRKGVTTPRQRLWLKKWNSKGNIVKVLTLDVSKPNEAEQLLKEASELGSVGGIFNSAVVLRYSFMKSQSPETFRDVCAPKAAATKILDGLTRKMCPNLDFFVCFSSVCSGKGNVGQASYDYANSVMERICEERRRSGLHGIAIQWGVIGDKIIRRQMHNDSTFAGVKAQSVQSCLETLDLFCQVEHPVMSIYVSALGSK
ncbi:fatty acid synthase isoform X1 [Parasteatoda tepidariorum]|uniref:fatty acid synthase isoform X1 n=1 Tax=Parasteatoda tepidariorum TaxID=114398 RepID=UPI00077F8970|nr:fatty acid synthase isoform X3 [Parasteatoda tepidariorum]